MKTKKPWGWRGLRKQNTTKFPEKSVVQCSCYKSRPSGQPNLGEFMIFEIIGLVVACTAIATLARGRGASPVMAVGAAVGGWAIIEFGGGMFLRNQEHWLWVLLAAWAWIGLVAVFVRFVIGAGHPKP